MARLPGTSSAPPTPDATLAAALAVAALEDLSLRGERVPPWLLEVAATVAAAAAGRPAPEPPTPEMEQLALEFKRRHYADWLDHPLPALGGETETFEFLGYSFQYPSSWRPVESDEPNRVRFEAVSAISPMAAMPSSRRATAAPRSWSGARRAA